jgi:hypothetical protein
MLNSAGNNQGLGQEHAAINNPNFYEAQWLLSEQKPT